MAISKNMLKIAAVASVTALALTACSNSADSGKGAEPKAKAESSEAVEIVYSHRLPDQDKVQALVDQWNKENPDIKVTAEKFPGEPADFMPQLEQNVKDGKAACLAQVGYTEMANAFANDVLEDATAYVSDDVKATYKGTIDFMNIGGKYYGIPQDSGPLVYLYDKAAFDELGIAVPTTADEFIEAAKKAAEAGKYIVAWETDEIGNMFPGLAAASGSNWYVSENDGFTVNANDEGSKAQAEFWQALRDANAVKDVARWDATQFDAALKDGSLIGVFAAGWEAGLLPNAFGATADTPADGTWQAALLPDFGAGQLSGPDGGSGVALVKGCAAPEQAMAFNAWFNDQVDSLAADQGLIPASASPVETPEWIKQFYAGQDVYSVLTEANGVTGVIASIPGWAEVTASMVSKGAEVQSGSAKVADIFVAADDTSKSALEKGGYTVK